MKSRVKAEIVNVDYSDIETFFENRASKYNDENPYSVTMYQDNHPELVKERNDEEIRRLFPKLSLNEESVVLDIACGIGRWADAIKSNLRISGYIGIDSSKGLIEIANRRNKEDNYYFCVGNALEVNRITQLETRLKPNTVLIVGLLMYMNDDDITNLFQSLCEILDDNAKILIREPIGIDQRLTLVHHWSSELCADYNAIYRSRDELYSFIESSFISKRIVVKEEGYLFDDSLNNRKETAQYYFILERKKS